MEETAHPGSSRDFGIVVVVASLGGLDPVKAILRNLPAGFPAAVVLVQHRSAESDAQRLPALLRRHTSLAVVAAADGQPVRDRTVTVIPAGFLARLDEQRRVRLEPSPLPQCGDVLLASAAERFGSGAIGVVLTGMQRDGTEGVRAIKSAGGRVIAQSPQTAVASQMPTNAMATGCVDLVLSPQGIAAALVAFTMADGAAEYLAVPVPHWVQFSPHPPPRLRPLPAA